MLALLLRNVEEKENELLISTILSIVENVLFTPAKERTKKLVTITFFLSYFISSYSKNLHSYLPSFSYVIGGQTLGFYGDVHRIMPLSMYSYRQICQRCSQCTHECNSKRSQVSYLPSIVLYNDIKIRFSLPFLIPIPIPILSFPILLWLLGWDWEIKRLLEAVWLSCIRLP